jgi:hypothetical protein
MFLQAFRVTLTLKTGRGSRAASSNIYRCCAPWAKASRLTGPENVMKTPLLWIAAAGCVIALASSANARSTYDGSWTLNFVTQRGSCDPTYNFTVDVANGHVTHPNLVKFSGYVANSGGVRASVTVQDKYASGAGRLSGNSGRGTWRGYSGSARCSGYWTAQRN